VGPAFLPQMQKLKQQGKTTPFDAAVIFPIFSEIDDELWRTSGARIIPGSLLNTIQHYTSANPPKMVSSKKRITH